MTPHPDDAQLAELAQGSLGGAAQESVEVHVAQCASCRSMLVQLLKVFAPAAPSQPGPHKGLVIGRYVVLEPIGAGALGEVFAAYDTTLERTVALKWLYPSVRDADRPAQRERLILEARALAKVQHPNVVAVHDVEAQGAHDVLVMELVAHGTSLRAAATRTWRDTIAIFAQAAAGLAAAHAAGVVHRDFKPDNVLLDPTGRVRVADFGLARAEAAGGGGDATGKASTLSGTPAYLAPERWEGTAATPAADQYSFCASLYECLAGRLPFDARDPAQRMAAMRAGPPPLPNVPAAVEKVVRRGLAFDPAQRWPSMHELQGALGATLGRGDGLRAAVAVAALGVLALGSAAVAFTQSAGRCDGAGASVASAWSPARAAKVKAAFLATGHPGAGALGERTVAGLDALAKELAALKVTACEAGESEATRALREACLVRRVDDLGALAGVLEGADKKGVERAVGAIEQLPAARDCLDVAAQAQVEPMPAAPATRTQLAALGQVVSQVRALRLAGKTADSAKLGEDAAGKARALGWRPLIAEALVEWGNALERLGRLDDAKARYEEAVRLALAANDLAEAYAGAVGLAYVEGVSSGRALAAEAWVTLAQGLIAPAGLSGTMEATRVMNAQGIVQLKTNQHLEAAKTFGRLAVELVRLGQGESVNHARILQNSNGALRELGEPALALARSKESLAIMERVLSPDHPDVATALNNIGSALADLKQYAEAEPYYRRCVELRSKLYGSEAPMLATPLYNLGELAFRRGDGMTALTEYARSRMLIEKARGADDDDAWDARMGEGLALGLLGRHGESLTTLEAVLPELVKRKLPAWNVAQAKLGIAQALKALQKEPARVAALAKEVAALQGERHAEQRVAAAALGD